jgi:hypothetical protein
MASVSIRDLVGDRSDGSIASNQIDPPVERVSGFQKVGTKPWDLNLTPWASDAV